MNEEVVRYCNWCGRRLVYRKKRINVYDRETGEPVYLYIYACPMRRLLFWHAYAVFLRDEEGKLKETLYLNDD